MERGQARLSAWGVLAIVPAFGFDTFGVAAGLGAAGAAARRRTAFVFAGFEGLMPVLGALVGSEARRLGHAAALGGALLLMVLGVRELWEGVREMREEDDEECGASGRRRELHGWALAAAGVSVSVDELAAGLAAGAAGLPLAVFAPALAAQAAVLTWVGLGVGGAARRWAGRYAELLAGAALVAVGAALALGWL